MEPSSELNKITTKLLSDTAKERDDGLKRLHWCLEGERLFIFCQYLSKKTAELKPDELPNEKTWPFLVKVLRDCVSLEVSAIKQRQPKKNQKNQVSRPQVFAKALRIIVQCAEDSRFSGRALFLLPVIKSFFHHIWDVLRDEPSVQFEYGTILRHLLIIKGYRFHMRRRVYCDLILLHLDKVKRSLSGKKNDLSNALMTLHSLLESPPGDFPDNLREDIVEGFLGIFSHSHIRDEGKLPHKLIECVNAYLLKDGPNLDSQSMKIHSAMEEFIFRYWLGRNDPSLKDALVLYARLQLKLLRSAADGTHLIEQLLDVVSKELNQHNTTTGRKLWGDTTKDDKLGTLTSSRCGLMKLAAAVFYWACTSSTKAPYQEKRSRRENAASRLRQELKEGKWLWNCTFCFLIHDYGSRISKDLIVYWFEGICESFEGIVAKANSEHAYEGLLWVLRSLQELCSVRLLPHVAVETSQCSSLNVNEGCSGWQKIWSSLIRALPIFSNVASVADAAILLLGNMISKDLISVPIVPQDVWDLGLFKNMPSVSALYFILCHFTRKGSQGDFQDIFRLRQNLLRAALELLNWKESTTLNENIIALLPAAVFSLCVGCAPLPQCLEGISLSNCYTDVSEAVEDRNKVEGFDCELFCEPFECSVEVLADIDSVSSVEAVSQFEGHYIVRLPGLIWRPLLQDMKTYLVALMNKDIEKMTLSHLFYLCAFLCNCIYCSISTRLREESSALCSELCRHLVKLLQGAVCVIEENQNHLSTHGYFGSNPDHDGTGSILASVRCFVRSPLFRVCGDQSFINDVLCEDIIHVAARLLKALAKVYEECSYWRGNTQPGILMPEFASSICQENFNTSDASKARIVDMELDVNEDSSDVDALAIRDNAASGVPYSSVKWRFDLISVIASFSVVLPCDTWEVMFDLMEKETDLTLCEHILYNLCQQSTLSSYAKRSDLVIAMKSMIEERVSLKLRCVNILVSIENLLKILTSMSTSKKGSNLSLSQQERVSEQSLSSLGDLLNRIAEICVLDWCGRIVLIDCICNFVRLDPQNGQAMVERLLAMLQDTDFRVRLVLGRRIGILFQTWHGHDELFHDVCSYFGVKLIMSLKEKLASASEIIAAGSQPRPTMETIVVTLSHLAFLSEKIEVQAVFIICVVAAIYPCQRELVYVLIDNLSRQLKYTNRSKYLEELIGVILFSWVTCDVSLAALVEIQDLFVPNSEPNCFAQYCCPWLLPALILSGNTSNQKWIAKIAGQPSAVLVKDHFVPVFGVCMALHCSKKPGRESGVLVLQDSLLRIADMTEHERDGLIKKHMVSIVRFIFSLSSSSEDPPIPFFSKDAVVLAIQTVVDGFLEMDDRPINVTIVDKINMFRADRVFMFIVELHYKITAAVQSRHKCHRLSGIEVLINIIGHRAAVSSTSNYLFSLVGQFIGTQALQEQCCLILAKLLEAFKSNPSEVVTSILGEQLQVLVSKLVTCCIPSDSSGEVFCIQSSQVTSLLHQLTVDSDPSLFDYIKELEPFPEIDCFNEIRKFHQELCKAYSAKDHFLKFIRRSSYLPERVLFWSLQTLHKKLLQGEIVLPEKCLEHTAGQFNNWLSEPEIVSAAWILIGICGSNSARNIRPLVSDFISRVGIGDPYSVVFHLPGETSQIYLHVGSQDENLWTDTEVPEELLIKLVRVLKKYLLDDSVRIIDITSQTLQGILSTERGQKALLSFDSYERSLIGVHSKGINMELVEKLLSHSERKSNDEVTSIEESSLWETRGKTYDTWICSLVSSLIAYSNNTILRLCQDIVSLKAEVAELLFPRVLASLAGRKDLNVDLCQIISSQVEENIFTESNLLIKSIQVMLSALNELRLYHVTERASTSLIYPKSESLKSDKPSSYSSRSRSTPGKQRKTSSTSSAILMSSSLWEKVYWLPIDYLLVAKSAVHCGSYFTSVMYVEHWCEEQFSSLTLGSPDFSPLDVLPPHIEILISAVTQINEPDSLYGIIQSHKLTSQIITYEHEGNWSKALEYHDLQVRSAPVLQLGGWRTNMSQEQLKLADDVRNRKSYKGLMRSLQQTGCTHVLESYCQGLTSQKGQFQLDPEFVELQYEAAWRAGNWDFMVVDSPPCSGPLKDNHFNKNLHSCLRALQVGDSDEFYMKLIDSKQELVFLIHHASKESTQYIYSAIMKLQILDHLGTAWNLRWKPSPSEGRSCLEMQKIFSKPIIPTLDQLQCLARDWSSILKQTQLHMNLLEPFIAFRRVLLQILSCEDSTVEHLLHSASTLRKGSRFSLAAAALHEFKFLTAGREKQELSSDICCRGRVEEAKLLRAQGQHEMAINLATYILHNYQLNGEASTVYRLVGKWLAETRSSNSRTILDQYLKQGVKLAENIKDNGLKGMARKCQTHFHLAHYADALFRSYEERLNSNEWQAAMRLRKHKTKELEALVRQLKSSTKGEKTDYSVKIQELQKQLFMDKEETEKLQDDRDNFLNLALEGYQRCLVIGDKYDVRVVFRLVSLWFSLSSRENVINGMLSAVKEVQSYKFIPLVYQIASRMGNLKDGHGPQTFQYALVSLLKKMAIDHPYHTIFQLLALANGDRVKDKQRSRNSFVVDIDKKLAAENLLSELCSRHGATIRQMKQMVEVYIKLAELETKKEDTNRKIPLPREIRSLRQLELVPVVTATFPVDRSCQYHEGSFPHFKGLADSITVMNGINAPKVVECFGSDGRKYRQLAKSGNDDLRQDAVMEQFFGLVNTFLQNHRDTWKRRLRIRTYKVVPFTPSAGVLEWVDGTIPLGEYLLGSSRNGGAHGRYGSGDWSFLECRQFITNGKDKRKAFQKVCEKFRPVMHYFFLERFLQPANWFERRLCYTRSVAASSMVGYIVGLGDRHSMNILIDQATAEVIHIDLGVAFEQGLMLKTPERVPFRLTRDIVDGMGVTGVDGVFRRCCEETLSVMRTNKEALLTIIEVFIHDPLYKWALSPLKALQRQKETDDDVVSCLEDSQDVYEGNKDAARALMRVKQKLDGYEEGEMRSLHGQVQQLIQDAIDPDRLCHMFPGWGAWL